MAEARGARNPIVTLSSREALDRFFAESKDGLSSTRLIGFVTDIIVPRRYLEAVSLAPVNFHPGPPEYPGLKALEIAHRERAEEYGATAHLMAPQVDSGAIYAVNRFRVPLGTSEGTLRFQTWRASYALLLHLLPALASETELQPIDAKWAERECSAAAWREISSEAETV